MRRWWMISAIAVRRCCCRGEWRRAAAGHPQKFARAIDLGCGTGLAARFRAIWSEMTGVDLSPRMIERARATGLYAELEVAEIVSEAFGSRQQASADLVLAADVMVYVHDMTPLLDEVARVLAAGGLFAFTVESHAGEGVVLGEGLRCVREPACKR